MVFKLCIRSCPFGRHTYIFVIYLSCTWVILPLCCCFICVCINMFVHIISMFKVLYLHTLKYLLQYTNWLYLILRLYLYLSPVNGSFYHCVFVSYAMILICLCILYQKYTVIFLHTLQYIQLGSTPSWGSLLCVFTDLFFHCCHPGVLPLDFEVVGVPSARLYVKGSQCR